MKMKIINKYLLVLLPFTALLFTACGDEDIPDDVDEGGKKVKKEMLDPNRSLNTTFDGKIFSVPSPIQTAMLIKSTNLDYNEDLLNSEENISNYSGEVSSALNLGIYGADLGYVTLYNQNAKALNYLNVVESLSNDLGVGGAFDADFLTRFEENSNNEDSMLVILTDAFRKGDSFLKENNQKNISALILTGGWIESMYFAVNLYDRSKDEKILTRIGEQKQTLETIIEILTEYNRDSGNNELIAQLTDLNEIFSSVKSEYAYAPSTTDEEKGMTTLNGKMNIEFTDDVKEKIIEKVNEIRNNIVS